MDIKNSRILFPFFISIWLDDPTSKLDSIVFIVDFFRDSHIFALKYFVIERCKAFFLLAIYLLKLLVPHSDKHQFSVFDGEAVDASFISDYTLNVSFIINSIDIRGVVEGSCKV